MGKLKDFGKFCIMNASELKPFLFQKTILSQNFMVFMYRYNYQRRYSALSYQTPLDKLKQVAKLLPKFL